MNILALNPISIVAPLVLYVVYKIVQYKQEAEEKAQFYKKSQIEFEKMYKEKKQELQVMKKMKDYQDFKQTKEENQKKSHNDFSEQFQEESQVRNRKKQNQNFDMNGTQYQALTNDFRLSNNRQKQQQPNKLDIMIPQQQMVCHLCTDCVLNKLDEKQNQRQKKKFQNSNKSNLIDLSEIANKEEDNTKSFIQYYKQRQNKFYDILKSSKDLDLKNLQESQTQVKKPTQFDYTKQKTQENLSSNFKETEKNEIQEKPATDFFQSQKDDNKKETQVTQSLFTNDNKDQNKSSIINKPTTNSLFPNNENKKGSELFVNKNNFSNFTDKEKQPQKQIEKENQILEKKDQDQDMKSQEKQTAPLPSLVFNDNNNSSLLSNPISISQLPDQKQTATFNNQSQNDQKPIELPAPPVEQKKDETQQKPQNMLVVNNDNKSSGIFNNSNKNIGFLNQNNNNSTSLFNNNKSTGLFNNNTTSGLFNNKSESTNIFNNQNNNSLFQNKEQNNTLQSAEQKNSDINFSGNNGVINKTTNQTQNNQMPQPNNPPNIFNNNDIFGKKDQNKVSPNALMTSPNNSQSIKQSPGPFFQQQNKSAIPINNSMQNNLSNKSNVSEQSNNMKGNPFMQHIQTKDNNLFSQNRQNTGPFSQGSQQQNNIFSKNNQGGASEQKSQNMNRQISSSIFNKNGSSLFGNNK